MNKPARYLLDTHIFLWLMLGNVKLKDKAVLERAATIGGLFVSPMTCWEIGMLASRDRIRLGMPCHEWIDQALTAPGVSLLELTPRMTVEASYLPGKLQGDPVDRILVASARVQNLTLVTRDEKIIAYAKEGYVNVLAC
jgi:PIN domain nuclease of toxin-antitoxin system